MSRAMIVGDSCRLTRLKCVSLQGGENYAFPCIGQAENLCECDFSRF